MNNRELIKLLKKVGYRCIDLEMDRHEAKTFYWYRRDLYINATENLSFDILSSDDFGLGRFGVCVTKNEQGYCLGTNYAPLFFSRLFSFLHGSKTESEMIDEVVGD